jgi:ABC-type lipoprotein release transport system permease subunit
MFLKIAFRNIFRQRRRTLLTMLTMLGGFVLCSFSIAWVDGSYANVIDLFTRNRLGHLQIHQRDYVDRPSLYRTIDDYEEVGAALDGIERIVAWAPRVYAAGLAAVGERTTGARIIGIDPGREDRATHFDRKVARGHALPTEAAGEALLGKGLAERLEASVGDEVVIVSQAADGSIANDGYTVTGIVDSGDEMNDQQALYLHLADAQELLVLEGRAHEMVIIADSIRRLEPLADEVRRTVARPELQVETWKEFASSFYDAMRADQQGNWISIVIIIMLVAIGVLNTVLMSVLERTREFGLLRAVGTAPRQVFGLVVTESVIMSVLAVGVGTVISLVLNDWLSHTGVPMPVTIDYGGMTFSEMYTEVNLRSFLIPWLAVVLSAVLVSVPAAIRAARTRPAAAMRTF